MEKRSFNKKKQKIVGKETVKVSHKADIQKYLMFSRRIQF